MRAPGGSETARHRQRRRRLGARRQERARVGVAVAELQRRDQLLAVAFDLDVDLRRHARLRLAQRRLHQPQPAGRDGLARGLERGRLLAARLRQLRLWRQLQRPPELHLGGQHVPLAGRDAPAQQRALGQQVASVAGLVQQPVQHPRRVAELPRERLRQLQRLRPLGGGDLPGALLRLRCGDGRTQLRDELLGVGRTYDAGASRRNAS